MSRLLLDKVFDTIRSGRVEEDHEFLLGLWRLYHEKVAKVTDRPHISQLIAYMGVEDLMWLMFGRQSIHFSIVSQASTDR